MATKTKKSSTTLKPIDDRCVVRPSAQEEKTASGIYLPESAKEKPMTGEVIAVGPGKLTDDGDRAELTIAVGDKVLFGKYSGTEVEIDGESLLVVRESELLGIVG